MSDLQTEQAPRPIEPACRSDDLPDWAIGRVPVTGALLGTFFGLLGGQLHNTSLGFIFGMVSGAFVAEGWKWAMKRRLASWYGAWAGYLLYGILLGGAAGLVSAACVHLPLAMLPRGNRSSVPGGLLWGLLMGLAAGAFLGGLEANRIRRCHSSANHVWLWVITPMTTAVAGAVLAAIPSIVRQEPGRLSVGWVGLGLLAGLVWVREMARLAARARRARGQIAAGTFLGGLLGLACAMAILTAAGHAALKVNVWALRDSWDVPRTLAALAAGGGLLLGWLGGGYCQSLVEDRLAEEELVESEKGAEGRSTEVTR